MEPHELGPNGHAVSHFLRRVAELPAADVDAAVRVWRDAQRGRAPDDAGGGAAWAAAEDAAASALVRTARGEAVWVLEERVHDAFRRAPWRRARGAGFAAVRSEATAQYLVATAAAALLLADALSPRHLATLYAPFRALVPLAELASAEAAGAGPAAAAGANPAVPALVSGPGPHAPAPPCPHPPTFPTARSAAPANGSPPSASAGGTSR